MQEYRKVEDNLEKKLEAKEVDFQLMPVWNSTLHHIDDLSYDPAEYCAHGYGNFRKQHASVQVRALLKSPKKGDLPPLKATSEAIKSALTFLPDLKEHFKFSDEEISATMEQDKRICYEFKGGETAGLKRLQEYCKKSINTFSKTRQSLDGTTDYSCKFSPWVSNGCLSIRKVF